MKKIMKIQVFFRQVRLMATGNDRGRDRDSDEVEGSSHNELKSQGTLMIIIITCL